MRTALIAGNWKLHKDHLEAIHLIRDLGLRLSNLELGHVEVAVHPPFTDLRTVQSLVEGDKLPISLGAQHCSHHHHGAFTGEVSAPMLAKLQTRYVLVGHSERRSMFAMDDLVVHQTTKAVIAEGMVAVLCVGETEAERAEGRTMAVLERQVRSAIAGLPDNVADDLVVAYEPLWAIGTGTAATPADAQEACAAIRGMVEATLGTEIAGGMRLLYGGSANAANAYDLLRGPDVDGLLVGGASLEAQSFCDIIAEAIRCYR